MALPAFLDIDWKGLALPFAYVIVLAGALMTFSTIYRKRKAGTLPRRSQPVLLSPKDAPRN